MDRYSGETFRFRFDPGVAYRLNEGMRGHDWDVRRDWRVIENDRDELVVYAGPIHLIVPRSSIVRVEYTDDQPDNGVPGAWPGSETFWVVPSLSNLVAVSIDPPASGHYGQGEWSVNRVVLSLREPDRFITLVKPEDQPDVPPRGEDLPGDEDLDVPLAPEEDADELCLQYFRRALEALRRLSEARDGVRSVSLPYVDFSTPGPWYRCRDVKNYGRLVLAARTYQALSSPELHRCIDRLLADGVLKVDHVDGEGNAVPPAPGFNPTPQFERHFDTVLLGMLRRWETFDLTDEQIREAFEFFFLQSFTGQPREWDVTIPLVRFNYQGDVPFPLNQEQSRLDTFVSTEKDELWNQISFPDGGPRYPDPMVTFPDTMGFADLDSFSRSGFALKDTETRDPADTSLTSEVIRRAGEFITALRLTQAGEVGASAVFSLERGDFRFRSSIAAMQDRFGVRRREGAPYVLTEESMKTARELFQALHGLQPAQREDMDVALRWFNQSYRRDQPEDRIVDLTIALESTLLYALEDELRFRSAVRGVVLLMRAGTLASTEERRRVRDTIMTLYDARSKVVHEGASLYAIANEKRYKSIRSKFQASNPGTGITDMADRCEGVVREILKEYLAEMSGGRSIEEINDELDLQLISDLGAHVPAEP